MVPTRHVTLSSRDRHRLSTVCVGERHLCLGVSSSVDCRSWVCIADLLSCAIVFWEQVPGHVTLGRLSSPDAGHAYVCAGATMHCYRLVPDIRHVGETKLGASARVLIFTKVRRSGRSEKLENCEFVRLQMLEHIIIINNNNNN